MASILTERGIGLELFQLRVAEMLVVNINGELDRQQALWESRDAAWNQLTGQNPSFVELPHVDPANIFRGHRPMLIEKPPLEKYPNISVMAYRGNPVGQLERIDQATNFELVVDIETAVAGTSEEEVDARKHRMIEAVHQVLTSPEGRSLGGLTQGWKDEPVVVLTDIYVRKEEGQYGDIWFWQMGRLRYAATRHSNSPEDLNIDQI